MSRYEDCSWDTHCCGIDVVSSIIGMADRSSCMAVGHGDYGSYLIVMVGYEEGVRITWI
jgi:hypothetical protein